MFFKDNRPRRTESSVKNLNEVWALLITKEQPLFLCNSVVCSSDSETQTDSGEVQSNSFLLNVHILAKTAVFLP